MEQSAAARKHPQILVVDDDPLVRDVTLRRLTSLGYHAIAAASGSEALAALSDGAAIDLLITDVHMPGEMHGPDLAKAAQRMRPQIKVLFLSGAVDEGSDVNLLVKPCSKAELNEKVREVLGVD